jgi:hypothetical protein
MKLIYMLFTDKIMIFNLYFMTYTNFIFSKMRNISKVPVYFLIFFLLSSCGGLSKTDSRKTPTNAQERARQNVEQGKGVSIGNILKRGGSGNFEFSSSNPLWRASLEILDFIPLMTADYSGGMIISDWYSDTSSNDSIKITIRFLSNEVRSDSIKIIVHKKNCSVAQNCRISTLNNSNINNELRNSILRSAALLEKEDKLKKKK